ncbi:hypothetical protein [uncultured Senegalimassilia sp.]|uniref:hypothetical protein n=1 Tax=uncultured Senegalimassilia sp. TaxID=1714350 RepID=UPI0025DBBC35|nr:hypothetical protein [uncultured Senegalimassilia sp.]
MLFLLTGDVQIGKTRWLEDLCTSLQAAGTCVAGVVAPGQWVPRPEGQPGGKHSFDGAGRFEKLGIDNVLLPQGKRIEFARRRDLAAKSKAFTEGKQAKAAKLGWAISDTAIAQVNAHFAELAKQASIAPADSGAYDPTTAQAEVDTPAAAPLDNGVCPPVAAETAAKISPLAQINSDEPTVAATAAKAEGNVLAAAPAANETRLAPHAMLVVDELGRLELLRSCGLTNALAILDAGPTPQFPHAIAVVRETLLDEARKRFEPRWGKAAVIGPDDAARNLVLETARAAGGAH